MPDPEALKQYAQDKVAEQQEQQQHQQQLQDEEQQQHQQEELDAAAQQAAAEAAAVQQAALQPQLDLLTMLQTGQLQQVLTVDEQGNQQIVFQMVTPDGQSLLTDPATTQQLLIQQQQLFAATQLANQQTFVQQSAVVQSPDQLQQLQQFQVYAIKSILQGPLQTFINKINSDQKKNRSSGGTDFPSSWQWRADGGYW